MKDKIRELIQRAINNPNELELVVFKIELLIEDSNYNGFQEAIVSFKGIKDEKSN